MIWILFAVAAHHPHGSLTALILWLQVYTCLASIESALGAASREIFVCRIFGKPYYLPRNWASLFCATHHRLFPKTEMQVRSMQK